MATGPKQKAQVEQRFMRQVDWNLFWQFHEIALSGSVSAAARKLNMHQPGLSTALKRLEEHVGVPLCRRTSQGIELTAAGKAVLQQTSDVVEAIRLVPHLTAQSAKRIEGTLRIAMISDIISTDLNESIAAIMRRHPDVKLTVDIATWQEVSNAVASGEYDVGLTYESDALPHIRYEPVVREAQQLYCGRWHPLFGHSMRDPAVMANERFILAAADEPEGVKRFRSHFNIGKNTVAHADDLSEATRLIQIGSGIGFLPTIVADQLKERLWPLLPSSLLPRYFIYLITPTEREISTPAQLFHAEMIRRLRARPEIE